jgi:endonuclease YncB( thermonuclease family)|tara:strand:+ start:294 stop:704 length:411 start_codon:yes stop_codon:yes gene_type:complete
VYTYRVKSVNRIVDGDTIDVTIDLGFSININQRVRVAGIDSPEKRTRDAAEKALGIDATEWMTKRINEAPELIIKTAVEGSMGKYGRVLGWLFVGEDDVSLNEQMINEGFAWKYDGGTKKKDLQSLIDIRKSQGTY